MPRTFTADETNAMTLEVTIGKERTVHGKDADEFREKLRKEIDEMNKKNVSVMMIED